MKRGSETVKESSFAKREAAEVPVSVRIGIPMLLLLAVWTGLIAGFLDVGLMVVNKEFVHRDFYRLGGDFPWIIPACVTVVMLAPTLPLMLIALSSRGKVRLGLAVGLLSFVGFLDVSARLPLELWSSLLVCWGLSVQLVRRLATRQTTFLRLVRGTVPALVCLRLIVAAITIGGRHWAEWRALAATPGARNVLLIVWDTVRPSNLSLHGYSRPTSPNLEQLASQGARFDLAFSTAPWTLPAHASMLTGRWPHELRVDWKSPLRDDVPTLAETLRRRGYDTAGFVANLDYCSRETGLARGMTHYEDFPLDLYDAFARYLALGQRLDLPSWAAVVDRLVEKTTGKWHDLIPRSKEHVKNAEAVDQPFLRWLGHGRRGDHPFFAFLNFNDAHSPYEIPDPSDRGFGLLPASWQDRLSLAHWTSLDKAKLSPHEVKMGIDVYGSSLAYLDRRLGILLKELSARSA